MDNPDEEVEIGLGSGVTRSREYMAQLGAMLRHIDTRGLPENWYEQFLALIAEDDHD